MRRRQAPVRLGTLAFCMAVILVPATAHAADPLLMFVLGFARNLIVSAIEAHQLQAPAAPILPPAPKSPAGMDETDLRNLVDESFMHLTRSQRAELLAGLEKALSDPANSAYRETILTQFVNVARQMRFTHSQLNRLTPEQKRVVAARFAENYRSMSPVQQQGLLEQLRLRALPLPEDLNEMMLAALER